MRRIRFRQRRSKGRFILFIILLFFAIFFSFFSAIKISDKLTPTLLELAEFKLNKYSTAIVNKAVSQVIEDKIDTTSLFDVTKSSAGEIQIIDFDPVIVNHVLNVATTVIQNNITLLENGDIESLGISDLNLDGEELADLKEGIVVSLPIGRALDITFFSNLGPKLPIRFHYIGDVNSNIETKLSQYGMNNALIEIDVHLEMSAQIYLPFTTHVKVLECDIPIVIKMIQGRVPNYYPGVIKDSSSIYSVPSS